MPRHNRSETLQIRISTEELHAIKRMANEQNLSTSEFIRSSILHQNTKPEATKADPPRLKPKQETNLSLADKINQMLAHSQSKLPPINRANIPRQHAHLTDSKLRALGYS